MRRRLLFPLLMIAGLLFAVGGSASADVEAPTIRAFFNDPRDGAPDGSLQVQLEALVDAAAPNSAIHGASYLFASRRMASKLISAHTERNVTVSLVSEDCPTYDSQNCTSSADPVLLDLQRRLPAGAVVLCHRGCVGADLDLNHQKIWVFDALVDGRTNVVLQTSENLLAGEDPLHNNTLVFANDPALADGYRATITAMRNGRTQPWEGSFTSASGKVEVWMSPRKPGDDVLLAALNDVQCVQGGGNTIRFIESAWSVNRAGFADAVIAKKNAGCAVEILVANSNQTVEATEPLVKAGITVYPFQPGGCRYPAGGQCVGNVHSKIMLVDGPSLRAQNSRRQYVYTGSHNIDRGSLYADDALLRIDDATTYAAYDANFRLMHDKAIAVDPTRYRNARLDWPNLRAGDQRAVATAASRTGYTAIVWEDDNDTATVAGTQVWAALYRDGVQLHMTQVSAGAGSCPVNGLHLQPDVGVDDSGNAYVAWAEDGDCRGLTNIEVRRVSPAGALSAGVWPNDPLWTGNQYRPRIAVQGSGAFTVVWEDEPTGRVLAAGYTTATARVWGPAQINDASTTGLRPDVAVDGSGVTRVAWQQGNDIKLASVSANGTVGTKVRVNTNTFGEHLAPSVAVTSAGDAVVAWSDKAGDSSVNQADRFWRIRVRGFTSSLAQRFGETVVTPFANTGKDHAYPPLWDTWSGTQHYAVQGTPAVGIDDQGQFLVAWNEDDIWNTTRGLEVYARGFNADGSTAARFPCTRMNPGVLRAQQLPAVAVLPAAGFVLAYEDDQDGNGSRDIAIRFGFTNDGW